MTRSQRLDPWIEGYLAYLLDVRRQTPRTVSDVRCTLKRASQGLARSRPGIPLWELDLADYLHWLEQERRAGRTARSRKKYVSHLRGLLDYSWRAGRSDRNVLEALTLRDEEPGGPPRVLTVDEAARLVEACPEDTFSARRDRTVVLLLYGCGLRTAELCALRVQDIDTERRELFVRKAKGDLQRIVPIPDGVMTALLAYLLERGGKRGALFRTEARGRALSSGRVSRIVREAAQRAGLQGAVTPKTLRHSFATHLMDRGVDVAVIASLMGHRTPNETGVYLHVLPGRPRQAVDAIDPVAPQGDPT